MHLDKNVVRFVTFTSTSMVTVALAVNAFLEKNHEIQRLEKN